MRKKIELTEEETLLYNEIKKVVKRANQRILRIERQFGKDKWAVKGLRDYMDVEPLQAWTKTGRVRINKSMSEIQLTAIKTKVDNFLTLKSSTVAGIKKIRIENINRIKEELNSNLDTDSFTFEDAESFYQITEDEAYNSLISGEFTPSEFRAIVEETIEKQESPSFFIGRLEQRIEIGNDLDLQQKALVLYDKFVRPYSDIEMGDKVRDVF